MKVLALVLAGAALAGCSVRRVAIGGLADAFAGGRGAVFASDPDPELVADFPAVRATLARALARTSPRGRACCSA
jgi:hypothetical protein